MLDYPIALSSQSLAGWALRWYDERMRYEAKNICQQCGAIFVGGGSYCPKCKVKTRSSAKSSQRRQNASWYDHNWKKIREQVLSEACIPRTLWSLYDVDHNPPYDPAVEPDHMRYQLVPRLHADHSRKTATEDVRRDDKGKFVGRKL